MMRSMQGKEFVVRLEVLSSLLPLEGALPIHLIDLFFHRVRSKRVNV
jgi:hypothetical protein